MRRITMWFIATVAVVVLLFSYRTSTMGPSGTPVATGANAPGIVSGSTSSGTDSGAAGAGPPDNGGTAPATAPTTAPTAAPPATGGGSTSGSTANLVVNGTVAQTRWGPVQVQVRISAGTISDVKTLQQPSGNDRDFEINSYALPQLRSEVLAAQSAAIDVVSGATVTSEGYRESLQAALDSAHFRG